MKSFAIALTNHSQHPTKIIHFNDRKAILTLSSSLIGFPEDALKEFLEFMNQEGSNANCFINNNSFNIVECRNMRFPLHFQHLKIIMEFQRSDNVFHLDWQLLIRKCVKKNSQKYKCKLNIYQTVNQTFILGEPCFRGHVSIFDGINRKIGFFKIKNDVLQVNQTNVVLNGDSSEENIKLYVILLIIFIAVLVGLILMIAFRKNIFALKKYRKNKKLYVETSKVMNSFVKDDSDVKTAVKEFEYDTNIGKNEFP